MNSRNLASLGIILARLESLQRQLPEDEDQEIKNCLKSARLNLVRALAVNQKEQHPVPVPPRRPAIKPGDRGQAEPLFRKLYDDPSLV